MPPVAPMLAKSVKEIPDTGHVEPKWDGFRTIVFRDGDDVELGSRNGKPMTRYFPELVDALKENLPERCVLVDALADARPLVHVTRATGDITEAQRWFTQFEGAGLDCVVAKPLDAPYQPDKRAVFKIEHERTADCNRRAQHSSIMNQSGDTQSRIYSAQPRASISALVAYVTSRSYPKPPRTTQPSDPTST